MYTIITPMIKMFWCANFICQYEMYTIIKKMTPMIKMFLCANFIVNMKCIHSLKIITIMTKMFWMMKSVYYSDIVIFVFDQIFSVINKNANHLKKSYNVFVMFEEMFSLY